MNGEINNPYLQIQDIKNNIKNICSEYISSVSDNITSYLDTKVVNKNVNDKTVGDANNYTNNIADNLSYFISNNSVDNAKYVELLTENLTNYITKLRESIMNKRFRII